MWLGALQAAACRKPSRIAPSWRIVWSSSTALLVNLFLSICSWSFGAKKELRTRTNFSLLFNADSMSARNCVHSVTRVRDRTKGFRAHYGGDTGRSRLREKNARRPPPLEWRTASIYNLNLNYMNRIPVADEHPVAMVTPRRSFTSNEPP
jgi:hypothetical protein